MFRSYLASNLASTCEIEGARRSHGINLETGLLALLIEVGNATTHARPFNDMGFLGVVESKAGNISTLKNPNELFDSVQTPKGSYRGTDFRTTLVN